MGRNKGQALLHKGRRNLRGIVNQIALCIYSGSKSYPERKINIHPHIGWFFIFGHSPNNTGDAQVRFRLACQPCNHYLLPINGLIFAGFPSRGRLSNKFCLCYSSIFQKIYFFKFYFVICSSVNLYRTTRLSRGFRYTIRTVSPW